MHKGDYHTDYSKYYDKEYKDKDLAFEHMKKLKHQMRKEQVTIEETQEKIRLTVRKKIVAKK